MIGSSVSGAKWGFGSSSATSARRPSQRSKTAAANNIQSVSLGADLAAIGEPGDSFLAVDLNPGVGGPGFTAGFVVDVSGTGAVIPATGDRASDEEPCPLHEILVVELGDTPPQTLFSRGDANADGKVNITDAVVSAQNIFLQSLIFIDCDDALDANNDEMLDAADPIMILEWIFLDGPFLEAPFRTCGAGDEAAGDGLDCATSNCQ